MLRILGQRRDGYHLLQTYFQLLNWGDEMQFLPYKNMNTIDNMEIKIHGQFVDLKQQDNLIYKAAQLLLPYRKIATGVEIKVDKKIPQGAGLGGGSSNAGTTLRVLNKLWQCDLTQQQLQKLAVKLGADVPIFVLNQSALATGIGEKLLAYEVDSYYFVLLLFPQVNIATIDVFADKDLIRNQTAIAADKVRDKKYWTNACLPVVLEHYPEVAKMYKIATKIAPVYLSGTGSTLFANFDSSQKAQDFIRSCPSHWNTIVCESKINPNPDIETRL